MGVNDHLYGFVLKLIEGWKFLKSIIIFLFANRVKNHMKKLFESAGISMIDYFEDDSKNPIKNGPLNPWDMKIYNKKFYKRVARDGTLGMGETYVEGWWDCEKLDEMFTKKMAGGLYKLSMRPSDHLIHYLQFKLFNLQTVSRSFEVGVKHYDIGNQLFESMLDPALNYTCAYWKNAKDLTEAQQHKMELIARKLKLEPGMRVLDLGCGFGGLARYLAETYKVKVVGCTISKEQGKLAQERSVGLPVDIRVCDYREINEQFDRIVAIGLMEHIGPHNYRSFMKMVHRCLINHGIFLLHTIGLDNDNVPCIEPWFATYIFPNGILPYHTQIPKAIDNLFTIEDWHNFSHDYSKTCMSWYHNFVQSWPKLKHLFETSPGGAEIFFRQWTYYLLTSVAAFRSRRFQLWQVVLAKNGVLGGYESVR